MDSLFGVSLDALLAWSLGVTALVAAGLLIVAVRQPLLLRLALRNCLRRPLQTGLIVLGLTLSTVVISTAFNTGDTITHTIRTLVARGLGRADEVVVALPRDTRRSPNEYLGALLNGSLLTGQGVYFPAERAAALAEALADDSRIAGLTPAIGEQVTVVNRDLHAVQGQVSLLALPVDYPPVFGALLTLDGQSRSLAELQPGELLLNNEAAALLAAETGTALDLRARDGVLAFRVAGVVQTGDLGGAQATVYVPLEHYQKLTNRLGLINQILIANRGEATTSSRLSGPVSRSVRLALANRSAAAGLFELLRGEAAQALVADLTRSSDGSVRWKLEALQASLRQPEVNDDFIALVSDPEVEGRLVGMARRLAVASGGGGLSWVPEISPLRVLEVKQLSQEQADRWGGALTSTFLVLGLFSLATGALLVFLIFVTLAAERRSELGIARAVGARRRDVIALFLLEGALLDLVASGLGLGIGIGLALGITAFGDAALSGYGLRLEPRLEPRSLLLSYSVGLVLTFVSVALSSWHVSRLSVVTAIRNLPEPARVRRRLWAALPLAVVLLGAFLSWQASILRLAGPQVLGALLALAGSAPLISALLGWAPRLARHRDRLAYSLSGAALLIYSLAPADWPLMAQLRPLPRSMDLLFVTGLSMVLGAVWLIVFNLRTLALPLIRLTTPLRSLHLAVCTATSGPLEHRLRTGMMLAMFSLVIFSMVVAGVLLTATHRAYSDPEAILGGFDIRATLARPSDLPDLRTALDNAPAVRGDSFVGLGRLASRPAQVLELGNGVRRWSPFALQEVDAGFAAGLRAPLAARASGYGSDAAVWQAVLREPGYAVIADAGSDQRSGGPSFQLAEPTRSGFAPRQVWVRDERGGPAFPLTVVGVLDPRVSFPAGLYTTAASPAEGTPEPQRIAYYLKARPGLDPTSLAVGLNLSLNEQGLRASAIGEETRRMNELRTLVGQLLQGFFAIGLVAGLAALGVVSMRAVVERRQQIGVLRALGFRRRLVRLSFLLEASLVALLGIGLGVALGLALSRRLVEQLGRQYPEVVFGVPWGQILLISLGAYAAALLLTALPVWQVGRIPAADALRYE